MEFKWRELATDPPVGDECVILFPTISDVGILYTASNPEYARVNALRDGYTHWFPILKHPDEEAVNQKRNELYSSIDESGEL